MNRTLIILVLAAGTLSLPSCSKHPDCTGEGSAVLRFQGFDSAALELVTVTTYPPGTQFAEQLESTTYSLSAYRGSIIRYDTANGYITWPYMPGTGLKDVIVEIAATGSTYHITEVASTHAKNDQVGGFMSSGGASSKECHNVIESYKLDGKLIRTGASPAYGVGYGTDITITR